MEARLIGSWSLARGSWNPFLGHESASPSCSAAKMKRAGRVTTITLLDIELQLSRVLLRWPYHPGIHRYY